MLQHVEELVHDDFAVDLHVGGEGLHQRPQRGDTEVANPDRRGPVLDQGHQHTLHEELLTPLGSVPLPEDDQRQPQHFSLDWYV